MKKVIVSSFLMLAACLSSGSASARQVAPEDFGKFYEQSEIALVQCRNDIAILSKNGFDPATNSSADKSCSKFLVLSFDLIHSPDGAAFLTWWQGTGRDLESAQAKLDDWNELSKQLAAFNQVYPISRLPTLEAIIAYLAVESATRN